MAGTSTDKRKLLQQVFQTVTDRMGLDKLTDDPRKRNVLRHITECRTDRAPLVLGECPECGHQELFHASCNDNCCPLCGEAKRQMWILKQSENILDCHYYHLVFTVPDILNELFLVRPKLMYNLLFQAASQTIKQFGKDKKFLGTEKMGFMMMLHTFGSNLSLHPHIHCLCAGCGLDRKGDLVFPKRKKYLFPGKAAAKLFKGKFMNLISEEFPEQALADPSMKEKILQKCCYKKWNVEIRERTNDPEKVMKYMGRYINRTAISCSRIVDYDAEKQEVTFKWKDYRDNGKMKDMTLKDTEFVRRYLMHVPPSGFMKMRYYGFWGNRNRNSRFSRIRELLKKRAKDTQKKKQEKETGKPVTMAEALQSFDKQDTVSSILSHCRCKECHTVMLYRRL